MNIKKSLSQATFDKRGLQKKSLQIKKSVDEVLKVIGTEKKDKRHK